METIQVFTEFLCARHRIASEIALMIDLHYPFSILGKEERRRHLRSVAFIFCITLLSFLAGAANSGAAPLPCVQPGKARWPVKISLPTAAHTTKMLLTDALSDGNLPPLKDVKTNDPRYRTSRINDQPVKENKLVTISGWLYLVAFEADDCDFHIQLSPKPHTISNPPTSDDNCIIVEVPSGEYATEISTKVEGVRDWVVLKLLHSTEPKIGSTHVMKHPVYVTVTGALFYDDDHEYKPDHSTGRGKKGMESKTLWEVHPVTSIAFAPKPAQ
jgi:hypothetical protein